MQKDAVNAYNNAMLLGAVIGASISGNSDSIPSISDIYPGLFDDSKIQEISAKEKPKKLEQWQIDKINLDTIAARRHIFLERQKEKGGQ